MRKEARIILPLTFGVGGLFLLVTLTATWQTTFIILFLTWVTCFWFFFANITIGAVYWIFTHKKPVVFLRMGVALILFVLMTFLCIPLGKIVWRHHLAVAETYPPKFDAPLEAYKNAQGHYPETLGQLSLRDTLPAELSYSKYADKDGYFFSYPDFQSPSNWYGSGLYVYESDTHQWRFEKEDD